MAREGCNPWCERMSCKRIESVALYSGERRSRTKTRVEEVVVEIQSFNTEAMERTYILFIALIWHA
jgi:hypothetical protein